MTVNRTGIWAEDPRMFSLSWYDLWEKRISFQFCIFGRVLTVLDTVVILMFAAALIVAWNSLSMRVRANDAPEAWSVVSVTGADGKPCDLVFHRPFGKGAVGLFYDTTCTIITGRFHPAGKR